MPSAHLRNRLAEVGLDVLVALLVLDVAVVSPLAELGIVNRHLAEAGVVLILLAGVAALSWHNVLVRLFIVSALGSIATRLANLVLPDATLRVTDAIFTMTSFGLLATLVLWQVFLPGRISPHRIVGAVAAYLLIGRTFAQVYRLIAHGAPGAFLVRGAPADYDAVVPLLQYYSFVTLTSLGFGDLTPVHPVARSMTVLEALIGVLYPAILIARLVSLEGTDPHPHEHSRNQDQR
jgi:hypothetical protein